MKEVQSEMFAVIRLRGTIGIEKSVADTLQMMRLKSANNCALLPETPDVKGMLQKSKDYITWGEVSKETLTKMLQKRLHTRDTGKKINENILKEVSGFDSFDALAQEILDGKIKLQKHEKLESVFRLTPPSSGFKSINNHYPRGDLGYRGKEINKLLERMI